MGYGRFFRVLMNGVVAKVKSDFRIVFLEMGGVRKIGKVNFSEVVVCWGFCCGEMINCYLNGDGMFRERSMNYISGIRRLMVMFGILVAFLGL